MSKPLQLRVPAVDWGKPDVALAEAVRISFIATNPATIIPWRPGQGARLKRMLHALHLPTSIDDAPLSAIHRLTPPQEHPMQEVKIGQRIKTAGDHPFHFTGEVVGIRLVVKDDSGAEREVDSRYAEPTE